MKAYLVVILTLISMSALCKSHVLIDRDRDFDYYDCDYDYPCD